VTSKIQEIGIAITFAPTGCAGRSNGLDETPEFST
jgi:hypothetical protein